MTYIVLVCMCIVFVELFLALRISAQTSQMFLVTKEAMAVMASSELDDDTKESRVRRCSLTLFKATFLFLLKFLAIAAVLAAIYYAYIAFSPGQRQSLNETFVSMKAIVLLSFISFAYVYGRSRIVKAQKRFKPVTEKTRT
jgi:hypothetical protein